MVDVIQFTRSLDDHLSTGQLDSPYSGSAVGDLVSTYQALDLRQFKGGVGLGSETADTDALDLAWAAAVNSAQGFNASGSAKAGTPFKIILPAGNFIYSGDGFTSSVPNFRGCFSIVGAGMGASRITVNNADIYMIDVDASVISTYLSDFQICGTYKGLYRNRRTAAIGGNSGGGTWFQRLQMSDFTVCALASNSSDDPFWKIVGCKFTGQAGSKAAVLPPGSGHQVLSNWLNGYSYGFHLRGGVGNLIQGNRFGGLVAVAQRIDMWLETTDDRAGNGLLHTGNYHGNENDNSTDIHWLLADVDTSGNPDHVTAPDYGSYPPSTVVVADTSKIVRGFVSRDNYYDSDAGGLRGIVYSYSPRIGDCVFDDFYGGNNPYLVEFDAGITALGINNRWPQTNLVRLRSPYGASAGKRIEASNLPGFGAIIDQSDVSPGELGRIANDGDDAADPVRIITQRMSSFVNVSTTASVSALMTDRVGGTQARTLTFLQSDGRAKLDLDLTNAIAGAVCWVEIDLKRSAARAIDRVHVVIGSSGSSYFRGWQVKVPTDWNRFAFPVTLPQLDTALDLILLPGNSAYVAGVTDEVDVGRIELYRSPKRLFDLRPKGISADHGDAAVTLSALTDGVVQQWNTPLTAIRANTLSISETYKGARFRALRGAGATGAFELRFNQSGAGTVAALTAASQWCEVQYDGTNWTLVGAGTL